MLKMDFKVFKFEINFDFLKRILKELLPEETDFIKNNDLYNIYVNAGQLKFVFSDQNVTRKNIKNIYDDFKRRYGQLGNDIYNRENLLSYLSDENFMNS